MKIVFVITGLSVGGAETMLLKLLERLDRRRFLPHVISLTTVGPVGMRIEALGIRVQALQMRRGWPDPRAILRLARLLRALQPDVVHTWMYHADLLGGLAAKLAGVRALAWCIRHSNISREHNKRSTLAVARVCALLSQRLPKRILVCSEAAVHQHARLGYARGKMVVIPNGFDLARFRPDAVSRRSLRQELGLNADTLLVGLVGRTDPQKNHAGFIAAMALLRARMPEHAVHFVLAGSGADQANTNLAGAIEQAGLSRTCHLLGHREDIPAIMAALDVLVSSSIGESFSNVIGEAMACEVPCVVTDVGDSAFIVGETGRVVPPEDAARLADATQAILQLPDAQKQAMGRNARRRVEEMFEIHDVVHRYESFYEDLLNEAGEGSALMSRRH